MPPRHDRPQGHETQLEVFLVRRASLAPALLASLTFCSPDRSRSVGETGMAVDTAAGADSLPPSGTMVTPAAILSQLHLTKTAEMRLSRLAARKASSPEVRRIAQRLADDHRKNRNAVRAMAQRLGLTLTQAAAQDSAPVPVDFEDKAGAEFDRAFVEHQINQHRENIEKIQIQLLPASQSAEVRAYLHSTVAEMQTHLTSLQQVQRQLRG
jgi:putative membrane protein